MRNPFKCMTCGMWIWKRAHRPTVIKLTDKPYYGQGDLEYTYPCGRKERGDSLPEFR